MMHGKKFKKRVNKIPDNMPVVIECDGKMYHILTAKIFRNQIRQGSDEYFMIIASDETKKNDLRNAEE